MRTLAEMRARAGASLANELVIGAVLTGIAFAARSALDPVLGERQPYTPAFAAVAFAVWFGGWRGALLCTIGSNILANYFFIAPRGAFTVSLTEAVGSLSYYFTAAIIIFLGHRARRANAQLAREAHNKDVFIATLSHELRNPLAAIVSAVEILARFSPQGARERPAVEILKRQSSHLGRLLDDLMDLSRITQGRLDIRRDVVDVGRCVHDAVETVRDLSAAKGQQLDAPAPAAPVHAVGDATRITQVVANLLNNAVKYSPPGARIAVTCERRGGEAVVCVGDNGPGIEPHLLPGLFEAFNKDDPRGSKAVTGLGIGLWLANQLVTLHGGRIEVQSRAGMGTVFTVHLLATADT